MTALSSFGFKASGATQSNPAALATALRTLHSRLNDVLNLKDFGAKGDGTTDDTAALNACIDYAYSSTYLSAYHRNGAVIFIPPGIYKLTNQVKLDRRTPMAQMTYIGAGRDASILRATYDGISTNLKGSGVSITSITAGNSNRCRV